MDGPWIDILEGLDAGVCLCEVDPTVNRRKVLWCNDAMADLAQRSRSNLMSTPNLDLLQVNFEPGGWDELYRQAARGKAATGVYRWRGERAERWIAYRCVPVTGDSAGLCVVCFEREVTEEIRARRRLRLMAARLLETSDEVRRDLARRLDSGPRPAADVLFNLLDELTRDQETGRESANLRHGRDWAARLRDGLKALLDEALSGDASSLPLAGAIKRLARERRLSLPPGHTLRLRLDLDESRLDDLARRLLLESSRCLLHLEAALPKHLSLRLNREQAVLRLSLEPMPGRSKAFLEAELERRGLDDLLSLASGELEVGLEDGLAVIRVLLPLP